MCGIVGAVAQHDIVPFLIDGLHQLEYRGYDSAGLAVVTPEQTDVALYRAVGKVQNLKKLVDQAQPMGLVGIAHTRWATHGQPSENNAHPQVSHGHVAVVHNGIIENHRELRVQLETQGYTFASETDTEVVAHLVHAQLQTSDDMFQAVRGACQQLKGIYALAMIDGQAPNRLMVVCCGSPLVIGLSTHGYTCASDQQALAGVADQVIFLKNGDIADLCSDGMKIFQMDGERVWRDARTLDRTQGVSSLDGHRHYMYKEMKEQPQALSNLLDWVLDAAGQLNLQAFSDGLIEALAGAKRIQIVACGSSYYAGLVGRYWIEALAGLPCQVEVASEFRYRAQIHQPETVFVTVSQSGETADTISALNLAKGLVYRGHLAICNTVESSLARQSDWVLPLRSGAEIGVASTKAFTSQLLALLSLAVLLGQHSGHNSAGCAAALNEMCRLPELVHSVLNAEKQIKGLAELMMDRPGALYIGRGLAYPIALEGALKLKEISYMLAQAYPAGELKHGPLALVDRQMPVIALAPNDALAEKLASNIEEVKARGGRLIVFADPSLAFDASERFHVVKMPVVGSAIMPIVYTVPLQLLAYHIALLRGHDVDQPRNLAKSVTVE